MIDEEMGRFEEPNQHRPVLKVLVRNVCLGNPDVQTVVNDLAQQPPGIAILLSIINASHSRFALTELTINSILLPPLTILAMYMSGRDE